MVDDVVARMDKLRYMFLEAKEVITPESEIIKNNLTHTFWATVYDKISHNELISIAVRGEVRTGKSTVVMAIMKQINDYLKSMGYRDNDNYSKFVVSDQTEFLRIINHNERNVCYAIDEFNVMAETGLNATTESKLFEHYSDVFAAQKLHRVTASPDVITDKNATIILDIIGKDEKRFVNRCKLIYRDIISKRYMTLGHIDINVKSLINDWISSGVKELIENKWNYNEEESDLIEKVKKRDFYVRYQIKKFRRMDLLKKHGIRDIRDMEYSTIILEVIEELEDFAKINKVGKELIDGITDEVCKRNKRIYSILTINEISQRAKAILGLYNEVNKLYKKANSGKNSAEESLTINKVLIQAKQLLLRRIEEQEKWSRIYLDYMNVK